MIREEIISDDEKITDENDPISVSKVIVDEEVIVDDEVVLDDEVVATVKNKPCKALDPEAEKKLYQALFPHIFRRIYPDG